MPKAKSEWVRCTKRHPCPICGKPDWCVYTADGRVVLCMRRDNGHPSKGQAGGWVYTLKDEPGQWAGRRGKGEDEHIRQEGVAALLAAWKKDTIGSYLRQFAEDLGVEASDLRKLGCVWCAARSCWAFPMRNEEGTPIGVRFRSRERKFSVQGSRTGLFFDPGAKPCKVAWITEGPTDTAAVMKLGAKLVIGRSDLLSAWGLLRKAVKRLGVERANLCADEEAWKDGRTNSPGRGGIKRLAESLGVPCAIVRVPGYKDIRDYVRSGGGLDELEAVLKLQRGEE